jgi:hypothetical protein
MQPNFTLSHWKRSFSRTAAGAAGLCAIGWIASVSAFAQAPVQGIEPASINLNITPKRLVLERGSRTGSVYIFNQGNVETTFDVAFVERIMLPNGEIKPASEATADPALLPILKRLRSAQSFLAVAPRRVVLAPGKGQTIRIRATQPDGDAGEYRSHLTVTSLPPRDAGVTADQAGAGANNQLSFRIISSFGISIPVILRSGPADVKAALDDVALAHADLSPNGVTSPVRTPVVTMNIRRLAANSLYGNVEVRSGGGKAAERIGAARGVGVYPEVESRRLTIPLSRAPRRGEQLEVVFSDDDSAPGRVLAKTVFHAP